MRIVIDVARIRGHCGLAKPTEKDTENRGGLFQLLCEDMNAWNIVRSDGYDAEQAYTGLAVSVKGDRNG